MPNKCLRHASFAKSEVSLCEDISIIMLRSCYSADMKTPYTPFLSLLIYSSIEHTILNVLSVYTCLVPRYKSFRIHRSCRYTHFLSVDTYLVHIHVLLVYTRVILKHMSCSYIHVLYVYRCLVRRHMACPLI